MAKKDVKTNLMPHSEAKVRLLGEYLKAYLNIICNDGYTKRIGLYDLFCGQGLYEDGGEGSPLVAMRAVKDVYFSQTSSQKKVPKINCYFNDIDDEKIKKVKQAIADKSLYYSKFGDLHFSSKDYKDILNKLPSSLDRIKDEKAFIFIDPYEYKHIKMSHINSLMRNGNSELLLWLPIQFMYRFEEKATPAALKDFIDEIDPDSNWKKSKNVWDFVYSIRAGFQNSIGENYYVDTFTIKKDKNTVFCLFFFSSHIKGFEKMLEAKWRIDTEQGQGWDYLGNQPTLFVEIKTNPLEELLKVYLKKPRSNGDVYEFTLRSGYLPKHSNEIFYNWQQKGEISVKLMSGKDARKRSFYLSYNEYRDEKKSGVGKVVLLKK